MQGVRSYIAALGIGITIGKITVERQAWPLCLEVTNGDGKCLRESHESETSELRKLRVKMAGKQEVSTGAAVQVGMHTVRRPSS